MRRTWLPLWSAWIIIAALCVIEAFAVRDYVAMLDQSSMLPATTLPMKQTIPSDYADAKMWVRLAISGEDAQSRRHWTGIDNAPYGRPVYWNAAFVRLVAFAGRIRAAFSGESFATATENALVWFNLPLFFAVVVASSAWIARRAGPLVAVVTATAMAGYRWFYDGFAPSYVDHHGLATAACFGVALGAVFMGAGWRCRDDCKTSLLPSSSKNARRGAIASAICGGLGLWLTAASILPTIAVVGVAGLATTLLLGRRAHNEYEFDSDVWRLWGRVGAATALLAYLVEFAPNNFGLRLEVNHPLYALAWWGCAEFVAFIGDVRTSDRRPPAWVVYCSALAMLLPAIVIAVLGHRVFAPLDPNTVLFHRHIGEFQSIAGLINARGGDFALRLAPGFLLLTPIGLLAFRPKTDERLLITFLAIVTVPLVALACWQVRWWLPASGAQIALLAVAVWSVSRAAAPRMQWVMAFVVAGLFVQQQIARTSTWRRNVENGAVSADDALQPMYRDAAVAIRQSAGDSQVVLLSSPNASVAISYFGGFRTIGTFYWENIDGMKAAAKILSSVDDDSAMALVQRRGITHIAVSSVDGFLSDFAELAADHGRPIPLERTLGYRLLRGMTVGWLRPIPFRPRMPNQGDRMLLFAVDPTQSALEADWNTAIAALVRGASDEASNSFARAIARASESSRPGLYEQAGLAAYRSSDHVLALQLLDRSLATGGGLDARVNRAWILATSADERVRNPEAALSAIEPLARRESTDAWISDVYAAALASAGRFDSAVSVARTSLDRATAARDTAAMLQAASRLRAYSARQPLRQ